MFQIRLVIALLLTAAFLPGTLAAQYASSDAGQYVILNAQYGTASRHVDVTNRLKELAQQDRTFRMGNSTFGVDPDPGQVKTLRIYARGPNGQERMFEYREGSTVDGSQFSSWGSGNWGNAGWQGGWEGGGGSNYGQLSIIRATYGAGSRNQDVTGRLRSLIRDGRLNITVGNSALNTDPAPGRPKTLSVTYSVGRGRQQQTQVREGDQLGIP